MMVAEMLAGMEGTAPLALAQLGLDLDGFFTSTDFLSALANAISSILIALLNMLTFGTTGV